MGTVYVDAAIGDDLRRERLYAGELYAYSPNAGSAGLCQVARDMSEEAFAPHDPPVAQDSMTAEDYAKILADLKPRFIHDPRCKKFIADMLRELGCDLERTYFDVPRLRTMAHGEYHEGRARAPVPSAPGHVVFGSVCAVQLVAARVRDRVRTTRWRSTRGTSTRR